MKKILIFILIIVITFLSIFFVIKKNFSRSLDDYIDNVPDIHLAYNNPDQI